jgi:hypothetical protein
MTIAGNEDDGRHKHNNKPHQQLNNKDRTALVG